MEGTKMEIKKIEFSEKPRVEEALTVWPDFNPGVQLLLDPGSVRKNSVKVIYCFGLLGHYSSFKAEAVLESLCQLLESGGQIYIIEPDIEYLARAVVGGDISIKDLNKDFIRKSYYSKDLLLEMMSSVGFDADKILEWREGLKFEKAHYEIVLSAVKK
jgi:predicted SAM-dependent methyltransferase